MKTADYRAMLRLGCAAVGMCVTLAAQAEDSYSPYVGLEYPSTVYFGDTHLHTSLSTDAYSTGNRLDADHAYRFAKGETVKASNGELHEKIYNVALSDGRKDKGHETKTVGSTVDVADASYLNIIGAAELATVWTDPDFNADELAFHYVRILEIPTPRWTAYETKFYGVKDLPDEVIMVTQERAYTSPIWYTP